MKWFALLGTLVFLGVAVAPSINADVKEQDVEEVVIDEINDWEQRLIGLVEEIISSYERTYGSIISPDEDCGCENEDAPSWNFPVLCMLLWPLYFLTLAIWGVYNILYTSLFILKSIGVVLSCWWSAGPP